MDHAQIPVMGGFLQLCREGNRGKNYAAMLLVFTCMLGAILAGQLRNGAYGSDLGGDPDEAAHAVTSLMGRDYIFNGLPQNPLHFAQQFYDKFPKVALGHYPPGFYSLAALPLSLWRNIWSLLILQAILGASLGLLTFLYGRDLVGEFPSLVAATLTLALPVTQKISSCIMSDLLLAVLCLAGTAAWAGFISDPRLRNALGFGFLAAAAILTKGSALMLVFVPPLMLLISGSLRLFKCKAFWIAPLPVLILAAPWTAYSLRFTEEGMAENRGMAFFKEAARFYPPAILDAVGLVVAVFLSIGLLRLVIRVVRSQWLSPAESGLWALLLSNCLIVLLVPAGVTTRYLMPGLAPALLLAMNELVRSAAWAASRTGGIRHVNTGLACVAWVTGGALLTLLWSFHWCPKGVTGFEAAFRIAALGGNPDGALQNCLVSSDARGEGAIVAAAAYSNGRESKSFTRILRASKELSTSDWMGRGYKQSYSTSDDILQLLRSSRVNWLFVDLSVPQNLKRPHHEMILQAVSSATGEWELEKTANVQKALGEEGKMNIYRRVAK